MRLLSIAAGGALLLGCAGRTVNSTGCEPVPNDIVAIAGMAVYAACEVDQAVRLPGVRVDIAASDRCDATAIQFVVNARGRVVPPTLRVHSGSARAVSDALIAAAMRTEFTPARKGDVAVAQLVVLHRAADGNAAFGTASIPGC